MPSNTLFSFPKFRLGLCIVLNTSTEDDWKAVQLHPVSTGPGPHNM